ncbi:MAG TPA: ATP-grasp domain-containing protein [Bacilli bacterium]|nr:ATP-grasp domain-containing protein [Bacilli bacterium]
MKPHMLIIGGWDEMMQRASNLPVTITLFQKEELATGSQRQLADRVFLFDYESIEETILSARALHEEQPIDAVVSFTEFGLEPAAYVKELLGIKGNPLFPVQVTRNKEKMREILTTHELSVIRYKVCDNRSDVITFWNEIQSPFILKPAFGSGSEGVVFVENADDVEAAWAWASKCSLFPLLAEEFIEGDEYSVEALSFGGEHHVLAVTAKMTTEQPHFIELGHQLPIWLPEYQMEAIRELIQQFLTKAGHQTGPTHTEVRLGANGPKIIESHTRVGGDRIWEMVELAMGVDLIAETLSYLAFGSISYGQHGEGGAAIRFFQLPEGRITEVSGVRNAEQSEHVIRVVCNAEAGDIIGQAESSDSRQGYVLAVGSTVEEAIRHAEWSHEQVVFHMEKQRGAR